MSEIERENKFTVVRSVLYEIMGVLASTTSLDGFTRSHVDPRTHIDSYFDTLDYRLVRARSALRIRQNNLTSALYFKREINPGDITERLECKNQLKYDVDDVAQLDQSLEPIRLAREITGTSELAYTLGIINLGKAITFSTEEYGIDQSVLGVGLDRLFYLDKNGRALRAYELEVELKEGNPDALKRFSDMLLRSYPLTPNLNSKYANGLKLFNLS